MIEDKAKEKTAIAGSKAAPLDRILIAAALAVILMAGVVISYVYRNLQPNIISQPASGKSGKAIWLEERKGASRRPDKFAP